MSAKTNTEEWGEGILLRPGRRTWENIHLVTGDELKKEIVNQTAIIFVVKGCLVFKMEHREDRMIKEGQMLLIPFDSPLWSKTLENSHLMVCWLSVEMLLSQAWFSKDIISLQNGVTTNISILNINPILSSFLSFVNSCIVEGMDETDFFELTQKKISFLLFYIYPKKELAAFFYPILGEETTFKKIVMDNFLKVKTVEELSALAHLSVSGFRKRFVRCFGESPAQWIARKKAEAIRTDILTGVMSLKEIACKYNFTSYGRFFDFCKTQFGVSPSQIEDLR